MLVNSRTLWFSSQVLTPTSYEDCFSFARWSLIIDALVRRSLILWIDSSFDWRGYFWLGLHSRHSWEWLCTLISRLMVLESILPGDLNSWDWRFDSPTKSHLSSWPWMVSLRLEIEVIRFQRSWSSSWIYHRGNIRARNGAPLLSRHSVRALWSNILFHDDVLQFLYLLLIPQALDAMPHIVSKFLVILFELSIL